MKKYTFLFIFLIFVSQLSASIDFNIEKVNTFALCQSYFSNASMLVEPPYMYALTSYGLEIYEIQDNGLLQIISQLPLRKSWNFVKRDNYVYVGSDGLTFYDPYPLHIYQVDVSDKYDPQIIKIMEYDISYGCMFPVLMGEYFIAKAYWGPDTIYTIPDLEYYGTIADDDMWLKTINDTICLDFTNEPSAFKVFNTSDIDNFQYITTIDLSEYHGDSAPRQFLPMNDTLLAVSGQSAVSFWNIENIAQWEYIGHYEPNDYLWYGTNFALWEDYMVLSQFNGFELVDVSDMVNPQLIDFVSNTDDKHIIINDNENIYVGTPYDGVGTYTIANNELNFIENFYEYPAFYRSHLYSNFLFVQTWYNGIYVFNITDPLQPIEIPTCLKDMPFKSFYGHDHILVVKDYDELNIKIYDLSDPTDPVLRNTIDGLLMTDWNYSLVRFDNTEPNALFLCNVLDGKLRKYDISQTGEPPLLFTFNEIPQACSFDVKNGLGYLLTKDTHPQKLYVIGGLSNNNPTIINTIDYFSNYTYSPAIQFCGDYLCMRYSSDYSETKLYTLDDPINPEYSFRLEVPATNSWPEIYDNILFSKTNNVGFVYDLNESKNDTLHYIEYFPGLFWMYDYDFYDTNDKHYLFVTEQSSIGVYEFNYSYGIDDEPEIVNESIICSPNPFSTSTTISFELKSNPHNPSEIKIYNVKGQLIKTVNSFPNRGLGTREVVWDGKNEQGKEVKSGVYLYKMGDEDGFIGKVVKLR